MSRNRKLMFELCIILAAAGVGTSAALAQDGGFGGVPTTPTTPTTSPTTTPSTTTGSGQTNSGQSGGAQQIGNTSGGNGVADPTARNVDIEVSEDLRNQGFVGATAPGIQDLGFVGATSELSGPPLASGKTFGGGVNGSSGGSSTGSGGNRSRVTGVGNQQGFGVVGGTQNGFVVTRGNVRAQLKSDFAAPLVSGNQIANQFNDRFYRLPASQSFAGQYQITIDHRTATLTGVVNSPADADRLIRQLRLQPGVDKIVNELTVEN